MYKYALKEELIESRQIELKEKLPAFIIFFFFCYPHRENCGLREVINRKTGKQENRVLCIHHKLKHIFARVRLYQTERHFRVTHITSFEKVL